MIRTENRESFFLRLRTALNPRDYRDIELAYILAKYGHRAQHRQELDADGSPQRYFEHLRRTALILIDEVGIADRTLIASALLHDTLEDTRDISYELLQHSFGNTVAGIVQQLSKVPKEGYLERLARAGWQTLIVKACDRLDNLRSLDRPGIAREFVAKQVRETREKYLPVFEVMVADAPFQWCDQTRLIRDRIVLELGKLDEILAENKTSTP